MAEIRFLTEEDLAAGLVGPEGPQGPQGEAGPQGETGPQGPAGADGSGITWLGPWDDMTVYNADEAVEHNGSAWVANALTEAGDEPGVELEWDLWVEKGDTGATGATGAQGPQGDTGPAGADGEGVPTGGTTGQALVKASNTDFDTAWAAPAPAAHTHPVADLSDASANGKSLISAADYAAMKALLDIESGTDFLSPAAIAAAYQPLAANLTTWAGVAPSANGQSLVAAADYAAMRTLLDLEAGTDFYSIAATDAAIDADVATHAGLTATHGATGAVVGTTNVQTLTNKTLTSPVVNTPTGIVKGDVGLGNVDNTSDANKPISTATQTALDLKAPLASPTFTGIVTTAGQIAFPATANPSADANTLDDYEEGTWTPGLTFDTPGDLAVTYSTQSATYQKIGNTVYFTFVVTTTAAFTHTTAASFWEVTGFPFAMGAAFNGAGAVGVRGYTKAGFTSTTLETSNSTFMYIFAAGSGVSAIELVAGDVPSGAAKRLYGSGQYQI